MRKISTQSPDRNSRGLIGGQYWQNLQKDCPNFGLSDKSKILLKR